MSMAYGLWTFEIWGKQIAMTILADSLDLGNSYYLGNRHNLGNRIL